MNSKLFMQRLYKMVNRTRLTLEAVNICHKIVTRHLRYCSSYVFTWWAWALINCFSNDCWMKWNSQLQCKSLWKYCKSFQLRRILKFVLKLEIQKKFSSLCVRAKNMTFLSTDSTMKWLTGATSAVFFTYSALLLGYNWWHKSLHNLITLPHSYSHQLGTNSSISRILCKKEQQLKEPANEYLSVISEAWLTCNTFYFSGQFINVLKKQIIPREKYYPHLFIVN